jgi:hypothetical protein
MKNILEIYEQGLLPMTGRKMRQRGIRASSTRRTLELACLLALLLHNWCGTQLRSQTIVAPNELAETDGNTSSTTPTGTDNGTRVMYMYDASQFQALSRPAYLTGFALRPDQTIGPSGPRTGTFKIYVSSTRRSMDQFSTRFSDNIGADNTLVFDGTLTFSTKNQSGPGNTLQFDYVFPFSTPFLYDPTAGNLVVDLQIIQGQGQAIRFDSVISSPVAKDAFASGPTATIGQFDAVPVAQFTFEPLPAVTIRSSQVEVCWESVSNATYRVEWQSGGTQNAWTPLVDCLRSTGPKTCIQDAVPQGATGRFYRVVGTNCTP